MKNGLLLMIVLVAALLLTGCGAASPGGPAETPTPSGGSEAYPSFGAYPAPVLYPDLSGQAAGLYPQYTSGTEIIWEHAVGLIQAGQVDRVIQTHDLQVTLTLKDGRTLVSTEPAIDEVMRIIQACGDLCASIAVATE